MLKNICSETRRELQCCVNSMSISTSSSITVFKYYFWLIFKNVSENLKNVLPSLPCCLLSPQVNVVQPPPIFSSPELLYCLALVMLKNFLFWRAPAHALSSMLPSHEAEGHCLVRQSWHWEWKWMGKGCLFESTSCYLCLCCMASSTYQNIVLFWLSFCFCFCFSLVLGNQIFLHGVNYSMKLNLGKERDWY